MKTKKNMAPKSEVAPRTLRARFFARSSTRRLHQRKKDESEAFIRERDKPDSFATELAQDFLIAAASGREVLAELSDEEMPEENGGPFVETAAGTEFAFDADASNPPRAEVAAFPTSMRKL